MGKRVHTVSLPNVLTKLPWVREIISSGLLCWYRKKCGTYGIAYNVFMGKRVQNYHISYLWQREKGTYRLAYKVGLSKIVQTVLLIICHRQEKAYKIMKIALGMRKKVVTAIFLSFNYQ